MKTFRPISAVMLALLVLVSSTSFMVGMHLCMGEIQNIALFSNADGCEEEQNLPPCHQHTTAPCCDDESVIHEADDLNAPTVDFHAIAPPICMAQPLVLVSEVIPVAPDSGAKYIRYNPPLRSCDLTVEHQVFLI